MVAVPLRSFSPGAFAGLTRRVAVVLNANAHRVDAATLGWVKEVVPKQDLFVSRELSEAARIADEIVARRYDAVLWGGGDGTFVQGVAALARAAERAGAPLPDVGVVPLGTGNAVAHAIGEAPATPDKLVAGLTRARNAPARRRLQMLDLEGRPTLFCGFGLDAQILDDLGQTLGLLQRVGLADKIRSPGARYFLAVSTRSVARFVMAERPEVVAVNRGRPAVKLDALGNPVGAPIPAGRVLWRGKATLAAASTIPFYGLGMKMFPHADREPGRFQLRLSDAGTAEILANLPSIWKGRYASPRIHDYWVDEVELVVSRPAPFQSGGDLVGERNRVALRLWDRPVAVV